MTALSRAPSILPRSSRSSVRPAPRGARAVGASTARGPGPARWQRPDLYVYDLCPFCTRARMIFGLKKIPHRLIFMSYDDVETPTASRAVDARSQELLEAEPLIHHEAHVSPGGLSYDDVMFFGRVRYLPLIDGLQMGPKLHQYIQVMSEQTEIPLLSRTARRNIKLFQKPRHRGGQVVCTAGNGADSMIIFLKGEADVYTKSGDLIGRLYDGAVIGEVAVLGLFPWRTATIRATGNSDAVLITANLISRILQGEDAAVARQRFDQLCQDRRNQGP
eukprot:g2651.t1